MIRPAVPVGRTLFRSTPSSQARRRTEGEAMGVSLLPAAVVALLPPLVEGWDGGAADGCTRAAGPNPCPPPEDEGETAAAAAAREGVIAGAAEGSGAAAADEVA